ncbi:MAG: UDP-N-acetylmuramoyl-L-alanyl-D-glutamate--2,6-diaminopimelate ligase [Candidatus Omnitrophota bacterium]|nr:MAG: UDP-N-acetylmuramoyl-L-alanyl-D-glutamate--2,6-diaminopimelate ligase [Candidatus Omnitrophota bacterium]
MKFSKLAECLNIKFSGKDFLIKGISVDSRDVKQGYCFIALRGVCADGHNFIQDALTKGARVIIYNRRKKAEVIARGADSKVKFVAQDNPRFIAGKLSAEFYGRPADKLTVIGITGTNGKTTVCFLIENFLKIKKIKAGVIGTIYYKIGEKLLPAKNTTPDALLVQKLFYLMLKNRLKYALMEVSSHALSQFRVNGIKFKIAVFTNLSAEHLDFHHNMETYFQAKASLFMQLPEHSYAVINLDDAYGKRLKGMVKQKVISYGIYAENVDVRAKDIVFCQQGMNFTLITAKGEIKLKTKLIGRHNIYNILACVCVALLEKISLEDIRKAIALMLPVPGRMEQIGDSVPFRVFVDYAHTDDALSNALQTLRQLPGAKIITVFGCGGDRDRKKRPLMGKVASEISDFVILTNDNPRTEEPETIASQIKSGFVQGFDQYKIVLNRRKAIAYAISLAEKNDFVLIAGKGHETKQIFKEKTVEFDDRKIVREILSRIAAE